MAKRGNDSKRSNTGAATATLGGSPTTGDVLEQRVVAFAEQLGRVVGTVQAKTAGWMDRDALNKQIAGVRDSASDLLEQLKPSVSMATPDSKPAGEVTRRAKRAASSAPSISKGRSGGVVDAPGKKHRKPASKDSRVLAADAKASRVRTGRSSTKTTKRRGRG
jgi:hypothetical protein